MGRRKQVAFLMLLLVVCGGAVGTVA